MTCPVRPTGPTRRAVLGGGVAAAAALLPLRGRAAAPSDPAVATLVAQVSAERLRATVEGLTGFPTRWTDHPGFPAVEDWAEAAFRQAGAAPPGLARQAFAMPSGAIRHNIIAGDPADPRGVVLIGAHLDSTSEDPMRLAPGANDNASGVAAMLEAHRILSAAALGRGIVSAAFAGEEQGLIGARAMAQLCARKGWRVDLMVNLDMLAHVAPGAPAFVIEYDRGNARPENDAAARAAGQLAVRMAAAHTGLTVTETDIWNSDYMPFEAQGYPAIGFYDGAAVPGAPGYHSTRDTADRLDLHRLAEATRLTVATVAAFAGPAPS